MLDDECLINVIALSYICCPSIYIYIYMLDEWYGFNAMDECGTFFMFGY